MARSVFGPRAVTSNTRQSGIPQGTLGGIKTVGSMPGIKFNPGDEVYLWLAVAIEMIATIFLRIHFRRHHGG